jgi:maltose-binding protein MalE
MLVETRAEAEGVVEMVKSLLKANLLVNLKKLITKRSMVSKPLLLTAVDVVKVLITIVTETTVLGSKTKKAGNKEKQRKDINRKGLTTTREKLTKKVMRATEAVATIEEEVKIEAEVKTDLTLLLRVLAELEK